jgi:hypothetical protein
MAIAATDGPSSKRGSVLVFCVSGHVQLEPRSRIGATEVDLEPPERQPRSRTSTVLLHGGADTACDACVIDLGIVDPRGPVDAIGRDLRLHGQRGR